MYKEDVIDWFEGSQTKVAKAVGVTRQAVGIWHEIIPEKHALLLDLITRNEKHPLIYVPELYGHNNET